jgi:hypothetical protein
VTEHALFLGAVDAVWHDHCDHMMTIRSLFLYLDRSYVMQTPTRRSLWDMGLHLFRLHLERAQAVEQKTITGLIAMIERERNGEAVSVGRFWGGEEDGCSGSRALPVQIFLLNHFSQGIRVAGPVAGGHLGFALAVYRRHPFRHAVRGSSGVGIGLSHRASSRIGSKLSAPGGAAGESYADAEPDPHADEPGHLQGAVLLAVHRGDGEVRSYFA